MRTSFVCFVLFLPAAFAQVQGGTIVVLQLTADKFVVAADSRSGVPEDYQLPPEDNHCKIAVLAHKFVFAATGTYAYRRAEFDSASSWDSYAEMEASVSMRGFGMGNAASLVQGVADSWAESLRMDWELLSFSHPDIAKDAAAGKVGHDVTTGIFAAVVDGELAFAIRRLIFSAATRPNPFLAATRPNPFSAAPLSIDCSRPCAFGLTDVFSEFVQLKSERAMDEELRPPDPPAHLKMASPELVHVIRLADATIAYDQTGGVHGPVDALELWKDGSLHWFQRKPNSPESSE